MRSHSSIQRPGVSTIAPVIAPRSGDDKNIRALDITVLAGGPGVEREVSQKSGAMVRDALTRIGHRVSLCDIAADDLAALDRVADVVFIALHGEFGEDGAVQKILDRRGILYTGTGADASALAMDKISTKATFIEADIPTPKFDLIKPARIDAAITADTDLPVVVKPRSSGSSVHTYIAHDPETLRSSLDTVVSHYGEALVERYVQGVELTVGVFGERALPVCEIRTPREFYNYEAKYLDDDTEYLFDIDLPEELLRQVQEMSLKAFNAVGCRDFGRVDWMVDAKTLKPYAIEINTIPGFTSHSLLPKAAARCGISFDQLCQSVIEMAVSRELA